MSWKFVITKYKNNLRLLEIIETIFGIEYISFPVILNIEDIMIS